MWCTYYNEYSTYITHCNLDTIQQRYDKSLSEFQTCCWSRNTMDNFVVFFCFECAQISILSVRRDWLNQSDWESTVSNCRFNSELIAALQSSDRQGKKYGNPPKVYLRSVQVQRFDLLKIFNKKDIWVLNTWFWIYGSPYSSNHNRYSIVFQHSRNAVILETFLERWSFSPESRNTMDSRRLSWKREHRSMVNDMVYNAMSSLVSRHARRTGPVMSD